MSIPSVHRMTISHSVGFALSLAGAWLSAGVPSAAAVELGTDRIAAGLQWPTFVTHVPGDLTRVFVLEKAGRIRIIDITTDTLLGPAYLDIDVVVANPNSAADERGLLGLAFHPDYAVNGYFYVNYHAEGGVTTVARYQVSGDPATSNVADAGSATILLAIPHPFSNHNGGWMAFGPDDGYLYIATGDGGSSCDPSQTAQDITDQLFGKMLRIDVNGAPPYTSPPGNPFFGAKTGDDEIWAYGLRNPWRPSFDRVTGDLIIADVGQSSWEEINFQRASSAGGENYGWDCTEGFTCPAPGCAAGACACGEGALTAPIHVYSHVPRCSITGGYVYRGCAIDGLQGTYFFADYCSNTVWSATLSVGGIANLTVRTDLAPSIDGFAVNSIASFGEDALGEIYIADHLGEIFRIIPDSIIDCNANGDNDACDLASGVSEDVNANGVPDACECLGDFDGSGDTGFGDVTELLLHWGPCGPPRPESPFGGLEGEKEQGMPPRPEGEKDQGRPLRPEGEKDQGMDAACPWDVDGSGDVGFSDYTQLLLDWGSC